MFSMTKMIVTSVLEDSFKATSLILHPLSLQLQDTNHKAKHYRFDLQKDFQNLGSFHITMSINKNIIQLEQLPVITLTLHTNKHQDYQWGIYELSLVDNHEKFVAAEAFSLEQLWNRYPKQQFDVEETFTLKFHKAKCSFRFQVRAVLDRQKRKLKHQDSLESQKQNKNSDSDTQLSKLIIRSSMNQPSPVKEEQTMLYKLGQNNDKIDDIGNLFGILIDQKPVKDQKIVGNQNKGWFIRFKKLPSWKKYLCIFLISLIFIIAYYMLNIGSKVDGSELNNKRKKQDTKLRGNKLRQKQERQTKKGGRSRITE